MFSFPLWNMYLFDQFILTSWERESRIYQWDFFNNTDFNGVCLIQLRYFCLLTSLIVSSLLIDNVNPTLLHVLIVRSIITFACATITPTTVPAISRDKPAPMLFAKCRLPDAIIHERSRGAPELKRASNAPAKFNNKIAGTLISLASKPSSDLIQTRA